MRAGELSTEPEEELELAEDDGRGYKATTSSTPTREKMTTKESRGHKHKSDGSLPLYGKTGTGGSVSVVSASTSRTVGNNQVKRVAMKPKLDLRQDDFFDAESSLDDQVMESEDEDRSSKSEKDDVSVQTKTPALRNAKPTINSMNVHNESDSNSE